MKMLQSLLVLCAAGTAACTAGRDPLPEGTNLAGTWVRTTSLGAEVEGLVLDADGRLGLVGIRSMNGVSWKLDGNALVLATSTASRPEPVQDRIEIEALDERGLVLAGEHYLSGIWNRNDSIARRLDGSATYRQRMALPPGVVLRAELRHLTKDGEPAGAIASTTVIVGDAQPPVPFRIHYPAAAIDPRGRYGLTALLSAGGRPWFRTTQPVPVFPSDGQDPIELVLAADRRAAAQPLREEVVRLPKSLPASWSGTLPCADCPGIATTLTLFPDGSYRLRELYEDRPGDFFEAGLWELIGDERLLLRGEAEAPRRLTLTWNGRLEPSHRGKRSGPPDRYGLDRVPVDSLAGPMPLVGQFTYLADAARFTECFSGVSLPVAMEQGYRELERDYLGARAGAGEPLVVAVNGRFATRPAMDGPGDEPVLVVEQFSGLMPDAECRAASSQVALEDTYWQLLVLDDRIVAEGGFRDPHLRFAAGQVAGATGCNALAGTYTSEGSVLRFGANLVTTMMGCPEPLATLERDFVHALGETGRIRQRADRLDLVGPRGKLLAHFRAMRPE